MYTVVVFVVNNRPKNLLKVDIYTNCLIWISQQQKDFFAINQNNNIILKSAAEDKYSDWFSSTEKKRLFSKKPMTRE